MNPDEHLHAWLLTQTGITDIVVSRIFPNVLPQKQPVPALVYNVISEVPDVQHGGPVDFAVSRWRFDCMADLSKQAGDLAAALADALQDFRGMMNDTLPVYGAFQTGRYTGRDFPRDGAAGPRFIHSVDYRIHYSLES